MSLLERWDELILFVRGKQTDYNIFRTPAGSRVLHDFAKFCRANQSCYDPEEFMRGVLTGRREVWLRIQQHLHLTDTELALIFSGRTLPPTPENPDA